MNAVDRLIQRIRIQVAAAYIPSQSELLDIGCSLGEIFEILGNKITRGIGIDPDIDKTTKRDHITLIPGLFPEDIPASLGEFDIITILAVLEHIPPDKLPEFTRACEKHLKPGGYIIVTVPSERVDSILEIMLKLRIIDGMSLEQHHGFEPSQVPALFQAIHGITLIKHRKFELGLNNLFVFQKAL